MESLELRMVLAAPQPFQLSSLLAANGGTGATGFALNGVAPADHSGRTVQSAGDVNGDGLDDLLIGAADVDTSVGENAGATYLVFGTVEETQASLNLASLNGTNGFVLNGLALSDSSGNAVSGAGDVNGDGFDDLLIGASKADPNGTSSGQSYLVFGGLANLNALDNVTNSGGIANDGRINLTDLNGTNGFVLNGIALADFSGFAVSGAGDVNGDGFDDLLIGAFGPDPNGTNSGQSYVVFGGLTNLDALDDVTLSGGAANDGRINLAHLNGTNGFVLNGLAAGDYSGRAVSGAGDVNGDGFDDLLIGAPFASPNGSFSGRSYVVFGGLANLDTLDDVTLGGGTANDGRINLAHLNGTNGFVLNGLAAGDQSGFAVSGQGDVNGDGFDDLLIGARNADPNGESSGQSYLVFGGLANLDALDDVTLSGGTANDGRINLAHLNGTNGFVLNGLAAYDGSGISVSGAGDVNGDGFDDLLIGAYRADPNGTSFGQSYVVFGGLANLDALDDMTLSGGTANDGRINLAHLNGTNGFMLNGIVAGDNSGIAVSGAGDVNGDGFADLLIGAYDAGPSVGQSGQSYVVFGGDFTNSATQVGTAATNTLTGSAAADVLVGGRGHDVLIGNSGADVLYGGEGDDILAVSSTSTPFARIDGGHGADTLRLDGSGLMLDLTAIADNKLTSIEAIDIRGSGANTLTLSLREVLNLTSATNPAHTANTLAVRRDADDTLNMGLWLQAGTATINGVTYQIFLQGNATLQVEVAAAADTTAPGLSITPDGTTTNASPLTFTFQFTETVTGFDASDVALTNGTKGTFSAVDGDTYTLLVTPTSDGAVSASVAANAAQDAANNGNTSATASVTSDRIVPGLTISPNGTTTNANPITFTFQFSETVSGFEAGDVMVANGTKGAFTAVDGDTYTLLVTPTADGLVNVNVAANSAQDAANNGNTAASAAVTSNRSGPSLVIDDVSVTEGHQGTTEVVFTITLQNPPNKTVELGVATAAGTATAGSDFYGKAQMLTFRPGGPTTQPFKVRIIGERKIELDETFFVNILYAVNATVADRQGRGTIVNDDVAPSLSISNASVLEGHNGTVELVFTVSLSQPTFQRVTVVVTTSDGSALAGRDYRQLATVLTFDPGGPISQQVRVRVFSNNVVQSNRTLFVRLSSATNAIFANDQALGTILDDDP